MADLVDPELLAALPAVLAGSPRPVTLDVLPAIRALKAAARPTDAELSRGGAIEVETRRVPGADGDITVLILRPAAASSSSSFGAEGPLPGIVHLHGGGLMSGDERSDMPIVLDWVEQARVVVVSVDYRCAPEHPYPAPVEDCYAALLWTAAHTDELGIGPLVIAGISAGYAQRICRAGGTADLHVWSGGYHGFDVLVPDAAVSVAARAARIAWLRRLTRP